MSEFEFRPVAADEMPQVRALGAYVFASIREDETEDDPLRPEWTHVALHAGHVVATSAGFPFKVRLNGRGAMADGVTAVGTDPGFRRRGLVRRMITDRLTMAHENSQPVAILWASMGAIYQRFGYGLASTHVEYSFDPRFAAFQFGAVPSGHTRRLPKKEAIPVISKLYRAFIEPRNLLLHRAPVLWDLPFRIRDKRQTYCAVHYGGDGEADGYLLYSTKSSDDGPGDESVADQAMTITDFVWRDMNGYRGLWEFIRSHDLVAKVSTAFAAEDDPVLGALLEPRILNRRTSDGIWLRVVDVAAALAARGYDLAGETTLEIAEDSECPWNVGTFRLATDATQAEAEKTQATSGSAEVQITTQGLASLLAGHASLSQLVRVGRAEAKNAKRLPALDALFSTRYRPHCMNGF